MKQKTRPDYLLDYGHTIVPNKGRDKVWHKFFENETYSLLFCLIIHGNPEEIADVFPLPKMRGNDVYAHCYKSEISILKSTGNTVNRNCVYIIFSPDDNEASPVTVGIIAHEIYHCIRFVAEIIGEESEGTEQFPYLTDWLTDKVFTELLGDCTLNKSLWPRKQL